MFKKIVKSIIPKQVWEKMGKIKYNIVLYFRMFMLKLERNRFRLNEDIRRKEEVIISLTSYPARYKYLDSVLDSLFCQTIKPDRIVLTIYEGDINEKLLKKLRKHISNGLEVVACAKNIGPHKKYYYTLLRNTEAIIITVDDDCVYPNILVEELLKTHKLFSNEVVASRGHKIIYSGEKLEPYEKWESKCIERMTPSMEIVATGVGGVLYPPHCLHENVLDITAIKELAIDQDDLWLKAMEIKKGTKTVLCKDEVWKKTLVISNTQRTGLCNKNIKEYNDLCIKKLMNKYSISKKDICEVQ